METEGRPTRKGNGGVSGFVVIMLIAGAFVVGTFWNKIQNLEKEVADLKGGGTQVAAKQAGAQPAGNNAGAVANPPAAAGQPEAGPVDPVTQDDHLRGNAKANLMLIEYSDFQCPYCKQYHPTMQKVMTEYKDKVAWVYRQFPLVQLHPLAQKAAEASECVSELGGNDKFWDYADKLFESSPSLETAQLSKLAVAAGINKTKFDTCLSSGKFASKISAQTASGQKAGVTGTPGTIILNVKTGKTQLIPGALPYEQVKQAIDGMI